MIPTYNELFRFLIAIRSSETQEIIFGIDCLKTGFLWIAMTPSAMASRAPTPAAASIFPAWISVCIGVGGIGGQRIPPMPS